MRIKWAALGALLAFVVASAALGATGDLAPRGCIDDDPAGPDDCARSLPNLGNPQGVTVSPDGRSVYVAGQVDDALLVFKRNRRTGNVVPKGCIGNFGTNFDCARQVPGLDNPHSIAVSSDGKSVYVTADESNSIARFKRNRKTGRLVPRGCIGDDGNPDVCGRDAPGLDGVLDIVVSPDGRSVYAGSNEGAVTRFKRARKTGALRSRGCVADADGGPAECAQTASSLDYVYGLSMSPNGKSLYATSYEGDAITTFSRNTTTGALRHRGCVGDNDLNPDGCAGQTDGLNGAIAVDVSSDGKSVYVVGALDDAVVHLKRNRRTGALAPVRCIDDGTGPDDCVRAAPGLAGVEAVAVSADGKSVYATARDDDAIVHLRRKRSNGAIKARNCVHDNDTGTDSCSREADGLNGAQDVDISADGRSVYAVSASDHALVLLKRRRR